MIIKNDYHIHTTYDDGKNSPREIVESAINLGLTSIGFSGHSHMSFDDSFAMTLDGTRKYINEIKSLKEEYKEKIEIKLGIELDYYSKVDTSEYDYIIGSVHAVKVGDKFISVDESLDVFLKAVKEDFDGDPLLFAEKYFETVADVVNKTKCNIIGHFDLITKFNENMRIFDENDCRYIAAYNKALDKIDAKNKVFEINSGAISRGYRSKPYPSKAIRQEIKNHGGRFILSSDSHTKETLCFNFDDLYDICILENLTLLNDIQETKF